MMRLGRHEPPLGVVTVMGVLTALLVVAAVLVGIVLEYALGVG